MMEEEDVEMESMVTGSETWSGGSEQEIWSEDMDWESKEIREHRALDQWRSQAGRSTWQELFFVLC